MRLPETAAHYSEPWEVIGGV